MYKFQWNLHQNTRFVFHKKAFENHENVICEMVAICSRLIVLKISCNVFHINKNPFPFQQQVFHNGVSGISQWETTLQCNVVSHWLSPYAEWSLCFKRISVLFTDKRLSYPILCMVSNWWSPDKSEIIRVCLGPISISEKMFHCKIFGSLEAARFVFIIVWSLWNLTSAVVLPMCLSNFRVML